ncbi:MAG: radical SAM protein [Asgard group archaeon]|nr:radical SAM protein [Asgard group archaeon]
MNVKQATSVRDLCTNCAYCKSAIKCPGELYCVACGACIEACPQSARIFIETEKEVEKYNLLIDGDIYTVLENQTILKVLESLGYKISSHSHDAQIYAPCKTGGCWSCAVLVNGELKPSCITPIEDGMEIVTDIDNITPMRIVSGFQGHHVGGVGTPKNIEITSPFGYIEVACFTSGCLYRCPTCQNWQVAYLSNSEALTPKVAARKLTEVRKQYRVNRMAISGGESTLNRKWLVSLVSNLKFLNPDSLARIHVDTNASILTPDYIDELVNAGLTDIGPDLKGNSVETFMKITNLKDQELAKRYFDTSWNAVKYILDNHYGKIFMGVGLPFNKEFMTLTELEEMGNKLANWEPDLQVTVLDYRPEFRAQHIERPSVHLMKNVKEILSSTGLTSVICQSIYGHIK